MHCKNCDYPLWNLKARQCPECGRPFNPSEYEFVINSVQFCCPHCEQVYYGTGAKGHLVPRAFTCVKCGQAVNMDEMLLRPATGVEEEQTYPDVVPWLDRKRRGVIKAWFQMIGKAMVAPGPLMRALPVESSAGLAWGYALVTLSIIFAVGIGLPLLGFAGILALNGDPEATGMAIGGAVSWLGGIAAGAAILGLWGLVTHVILRLTGGCTWSIKRTYQSICYSVGALTPLGVPCLGLYCGIYFLWIWCVVSAILMVKEGQQVHGGRAALAVLATPVSAVALTVGSYVVFFYIFFSSAAAGGAFGPGWPGAPGSPDFDTWIVTNGISSYVQRNGQPPTHALQLVAQGEITGWNLVSTGGLPSPRGVPAAGTNLAQFETLDARRQRTLASEAAAALPENVVAHRLGDFVFVHHGIDFAMDDGGLWVVILRPEQPAPGPGQASNLCAAGKVDGTVRSFPIATMPEELAAQNALRASCGLPPLPDPVTVTHDQPATAGQ
ncbi:MAG: hypothetical protein SYC29_02420 [Planctomycetota bacterium]|nr:hypothetical protein [Planctomycetota bacterium]